MFNPTPKATSLISLLPLVIGIFIYSPSKLSVLALQIIPNDNTCHSQFTLFNKQTNQIRALSFSRRKQNYQVHRISLSAQCFRLRPSLSFSRELGSESSIALFSAKTEDRDGGKSNAFKETKVTSIVNSIGETILKDTTDTTSNGIPLSIEEATLRVANITNSSASDNATYKSGRYDLGLGKNLPKLDNSLIKKGRRIIANDEHAEFLSRAIYDYDNKDINSSSSSKEIKVTNKNDSKANKEMDANNTKRSTLEIDLSITPTDYDESQNVDRVWDLLRKESRREADIEPLLVSFLYSTILNHDSLESALAFHLANRLSSPNMMATQIMSLLLEAMRNDANFGKSIRADMMAVRERDPACTALPDVFLYFKGFHALQTHRAAHYLWNNNRKVLAHFLQSQMSQVFQIDIHPNATMGSGIMLDHGTGIMIGETAVVGHNCSILHHVTLGGSGRRGNDRHPKVGNGVLIGAGASVLGNINVGDGCQIGAGTLVIGDLPKNSVAVGVPAKIIGRFVDDNAQPSATMNQLGSLSDNDGTIQYYVSAGI
mmetsp:Transcript_1387/g.1476  ORF Transcript_1387/g.1476 Transcript_1387/m.1476 type:complete len:543 (-) Transcript_1387:69-1697(-)|eukprot:CAMPEP_0194380980 /NCGR_PEP_ID=MMETSP0174-20130528/49279_1 /TAXON_ID=216777 /ORGANISM="Proboscia alata, Strain PI-D3" /LENGTH=542 /DNA_ID=CAMNT_0039164869 /DNA_START=44 /DNA_END=1672 /DNA_ORIENTATION=+